MRSAALALLLLACSTASPTAAPSELDLVVLSAATTSSVIATAAAVDIETPPERVSVELFVMSQCPYASRLEVALAEATKRLGNVDLRVSFIGTIGANGELGSMHGPAELTGDAAQICAMRYSTSWLAMIACQNRSFKDSDFNWRECAADLGMPLQAIEACTFGSEAKTLLAQSFEYAISRGANASPTIFIGDRKYSGGRLPKDLIAAVCDLSKSKPAVCSTLASAPEVPVTALFDRRCSGCDAGRENGDALARLLNPKLTVLDYQTPEGRTLFDAVRPSGLPLYLFGPALDGDASAIAAFGARLRQTTEGRVLEDGAWSPRCADVGGCGAPQCKAAMPCRAERPKKLELYLEDSSPLSTPAVVALREVLDNFDQRGNALTFSIHQISTNPRRGATPASTGELDEARRRLCVQKLAPGKPLMRYIGCRAAALPEDSWQSCAGGKTGLDAAKVEKCTDGAEGAKLLADSRKRARESDITSGATFVVNDKSKLRTVHADALKRAVCAANAKLAGCEGSLSSVFVK